MDALIPTEKMVEFLSSSRLFGHFDPGILKKIAATLKMVPLKGGQILMKKNDPGDSLYLVFSGRLRASIIGDDGTDIPTGEIGFGEIVGEIALILGEPRTATVRAIRDSILFEFKKEDYENLSRHYYQISEDISRFCVKRLLTKKAYDRSKFVTIAFIPAGNNPKFSDFVPRVASTLESIGSTLYLNKERFNQLYGQGRDVAQTPFESAENASIVLWLHEQEMKHRYIIYETDVTLTQWTLRCLRQVDRIILVGASEEDAALNEVEDKLLSSKELGYATLDLVLLHQSTSDPTNTMDWLKSRSVHDHHHIQIDSSRDYARFIRFLTGRSLGLVLAGGGLRGAAYIGLFRALEELKINIDIVGANSAGAFLGGLYVKGIDHKEMRYIIFEKLRKAFKYNYTYPMISLFTGKFLTEYMHGSLGDVNIEDLWRKFFCISYNLSRNNVHVHSHGMLYKAVRTSSAIPGMLPPVIDDAGEMFVDGGIFNNLPVDIMRQRIAGGKILAVNLISQEIPRYDKIDFAVSGWRLLFQKMFSSKEKQKKLPTIGDVIVSSMISASRSREEEAIKQANYYIGLDVGHMGMFQTKGLNELINASYVHFLQELEQLFNT